jgi:MFS transporter, FHS family, L-fucose permease
MTGGRYAHRKRRHFPAIKRNIRKQGLPCGAGYGDRVLFFFWGFVTVLNDILVPHLKSVFDLNYTKVMLIQFAFFSAYFIFSTPSAKIIDAIGYKKTMVVGLVTMGIGAFLFIPAASALSYPRFLG